jgi:hypothetical protein
MQARGAVVTATAGFVVWVQGTKGPELQRWAERPMNARILAVVPVPAEDFAQPLDEISGAKEPGRQDNHRRRHPQSAGVRSMIVEQTQCRA